MAGRPFCGYNVTSATKEIVNVRSPSRTALVTLFVLAACESPPAPQPDYAARVVVPLARWRVEVQDEELGTEVLGQVVEFEIRDPSGPIRFYRVLDRAGRWLGHATENGRFSRRVPFQDEEQDLGVLAMNRGVALLLECDAPVSLQPVPIEADWQRSR